MSLVSGKAIQASRFNRFSVVVQPVIFHLMVHTEKELRIGMALVSSQTIQANPFSYSAVTRLSEFEPLLSFDLLDVCQSACDEVCGTLRLERA